MTNKLPQDSTHPCHLRENPMVSRRPTPYFWFGLCSVAALTATLSGCKPPPPTSPPNVVTQQPAVAAPAAGGAAPAAATPAKEPQEELIDGLPKAVVENVEQVIKLTAEYNLRAEKITDRQTYLDQSASLAELENELSNYVQYMESIEPTLTAAQQATLDSKYFSRAKPLIDAKRQHKMRLLALLQ